MDNDFATGYALGSDSNGGNCNNGFGGGAWDSPSSTRTVSGRPWVST